MNKIYLDTYSLAYPSEDEETPSNDFEIYLENILSWRDLKDIKWLEIYTSKQASDLLMKHNNYPYWDNLKETLIKTGLNKFYQPRDIIDVIDGLLQKPTIEDRLDLSDILIENVDVTPATHLLLRPNIYSDEYKRMLMLVSLSSFLYPDIDENYIISRDIGVERVSVSGEILHCEFNDEEINLTYPLLLEESFTSCNQIPELIMSVNTINLWRNARNIGDYIDTLNIILYKRLKTMGEDPNNIPKWKFGTEFINSCRDMGFLHVESRISSLLRSCADTILTQNLNATHALRTGESGNSPQITRQNDKAWRRDIDYEFHLHYWQTNIGSELACVVTHNNMIIHA